MNKKVFIIANRSFHNGPRMIREIKALKDDFEITTMGLSAPSDSSIPFYNITNFITTPNKAINKIGRILHYKKISKGIGEWFPKIAKFIRDQKFDAVIIHDINFLPTVARLKSKMPIKVIYNAHEYHPLEFEEKPNWVNTHGRYYYALYQKYIHQVDLFINVCNGIANKCKEEFNIESLVIPNAASFINLPVRENAGNMIKMIYHGGIMQSRRIEDIIDIARILGKGYSLDIVAMPSKFEMTYYEEIKKRIAQCDNVFLKDPVNFSEIIPLISQYDLGLYLLQPANFNNLYALPNKIFEFIQARLAIAISPSPEMKRLVEKYDLGIVADDFTPANLASKIKVMTRTELHTFKMNANKAASIEHAEHYEKLYLLHMKALFN
ncbi:MAG: glycosyltransferase [Bacteroidetes bacterium]|nr:glycosyltransferase [Bacteroidota bacterium]